MLIISLGSLLPSYIRDSSVAVIVYDVTDRSTFVNTDKWIEDVRSVRGKETIIVLVGNKTDLEEKRDVSTDEGQHKANEQDLLFIETSAKAGENIKTLFKNIAAALIPGAKEEKPPSMLSFDLFFS